jgi:RNA polymerase sigma-70 factor, ECF subfamily
VTAGPTRHVAADKRALTEQVGKMDFWQIYEEHYFRVKKFVRVLVRDEWIADDVTQETFARAQDRLSDLRDESKVSPWLFRIAYNLCQDNFRRNSKSLIAGAPHEQEVETAEEIPVGKKFEQHEMGVCVQHEVDRLPESLRMVIILFDMMEFNHREIADLLGITVENVKVRLHRARKKLKTLLKQRCTFETDERNVLVCEPRNTHNSCK